MSNVGLESRTIEALRFPLAAMVVLLHTGALGVGSTQPVYRTLSILTSAGICRIAVPCFFFISGFLFYTKLHIWDWSIWTGKLKKRIKTLLVPYLLWNIIAALVIYAYSSWRISLEGGIPLSFSEHLSAWGGWWDSGVSFDGPLWFVRDLMILCLLAPLIYWLVKRMKAWWLLIVSIVYLICGQHMEGLLFFSAGSYLRLNRNGILTVFSRVRFPSLLLSLVLLIAIYFSYPHPQLYQACKGLFVICGTVTAFNLTASALDKGFVREHPLLSNCSFFVFTAHNILILHDVSHSIVLHLIPFRWGELFNCIDLFLRPTIAVAICVAIYWIMSKITPRTLGLLTGGRVV